MQLCFDILINVCFRAWILNYIILNVLTPYEYSLLICMISCGCSLFALISEVCEKGFVAAWAELFCFCPAARCCCVIGQTVTIRNMAEGGPSHTADGGTTSVLSGHMQGWGLGTCSPREEQRDTHTYLTKKHNASFFTQLLLQQIVWLVNDWAWIPTNLKVSFTLEHI